MRKPKPTRNAPEEVDAYLASLSEDFRATLQQLRGITKRIASDCTGRVNYQIPIFQLKRNIVAMLAATKHVGFHTMSKAIPAAIKKNSPRWESGFPVRLTHQARAGLPEALLIRALRTRLAELEGGG